MAEDVVIERFELLRKMVYRHADNLGYVVLDEVVNRKKRRAVARMDLTPEALEAYLEDEGGIEDLELDDGGEEEDDDGEAEEDDEDELPDGVDLDGETLALCRALLRWLPREVETQLGDRARGTFKFSLYQPKGDYIVSKNFRAGRPPPPAPPPAAPERPPLTQPVLFPPLGRDALPGPAGTPALPGLPVAASSPSEGPPTPAAPNFALAVGGDGRGQLVYLDLDTIPEARVWRALGRATEDLLVTVSRTYSGIIELQARTVLHQADQLDRSQRLVENLASQLLAARRVQAQDEAEARADESQLRMREALGRTFLSELGTLGRVLVASRAGLAPELAELGELVAGSPELAEALRDPQVRAMLQDEGTRKELAQLLRLAARRPPEDGGGSPQAA